MADLMCSVRVREAPNHAHAQRSSDVIDQDAQRRSCLPCILSVTMPRLGLLITLLVRGKPTSPCPLMIVLQRTVKDTAGHA